MTTVFHTWAFCRFIDLQSNLRRKKLHRTHESSNFLRGDFSNRYNVRAPTQFRREGQPQHDDFSSKTDSSIFTLIEPVLLDQSNENSQVFPALKLTSNFLPQSTVSRRSYSSSEANSSCCRKLDAWSHLELRVVSSA